MPEIGKEGETRGVWCDIGCCCFGSGDGVGLGKCEDMSVDIRT